MLDSAFPLARCEGPDARGPALASHASCDANGVIRESIKFGHGGKRAGAGRPRKAVPPMPLDVPRWYVVRSRFKQERLADIEIRIAGFEVFNPSIWKAGTPLRRDSNGVVRPARPDRIDSLFKRFFFTRLNLADPSWHAIKHLPGVERIMDGVGTPGVPVAVPDLTIDLIRSMLEPNLCLYPASHPSHHHVTPLQVGTAQRFLTGAMSGCQGIVTWSDGARVRLLMEILGREAPVSTTRDSIEAV
jgi:transcription antitermination factor NusG